MCGNAICVLEKTTMDAKKLSFMSQHNWLVCSYESDVSGMTDAMHTTGRVHTGYVTKFYARPTVMHAAGRMHTAQTHRCYAYGHILHNSRWCRCWRHFSTFFFFQLFMDLPVRLRNVWISISKHLEHHPHLRTANRQTYKLPMTMPILHQKAYRLQRHHHHHHRSFPRSQSQRRSSSLQSNIIG